ncbi:outer membrane beta-barrel protein [Salinibius halmophilus]|uniref:outer membrane beta-barrel protein n=1 Tax=Salinibius halmophilus TaxID=1853216 RepID=UPI000E672EF6|nr:outer membrane beta-barrel protein [Salinibius halmophilus]
MKLLPLSILAVSSLAAAEFAPDAISVAGGDLTPTLLSKAGFAQTGDNGETSVSLAPAVNYTLVSGASTYTVNAGLDAGHIAGDGYSENYLDGFANGEGLFDLSASTRLIAAAGVVVESDGTAVAGFDAKTTVSAGGGVQLGDEAASDLVVVTRLGVEAVSFDTDAREAEESFAVNALIESNYRLDATLALLANVSASSTTFEENDTADSVDYAAEAGVAWVGVAMSEGSFLVGVKGDSFANNSAADYSNITVKLNNVWTPTELLAVTLNASHVPTGVKADETILGLSANYAVASNLGVSAGVTHTLDDSTEAKLGALYSFRRNVQLGGGFTHTAPETGDATNAVELTLNVGL